MAKRIGYYVHWIDNRGHAEATNHHLYKTRSAAQAFMEREQDRINALIKAGVLAQKQSMHLVLDPVEY